ncbi:MAG TPA: hypothetical protein VFU98_07690 [Microlunatus sp.]|nr:hypothetical protein [Microlunatus sp.]
MRPERYDTRYRPVLAEDQVIRVDTTDLDAVDVAQVTGQIRQRLTRTQHQIEPE